VSPRSTPLLASMTALTTRPATPASSNASRQPNAAARATITGGAAAKPA
jgi:hypothetical protein